MNETSQADPIEETYVYPFYLACDEGASMAGDSIDAVNEGIVQLFETIVTDPLVDDKVRVGIIAFSDVAEVIQPLTQLSQVAKIPACVVKGSTSYHSAFTKLKDEIDNDVKNLKAAASRVVRPVVLFVSKGEPNDDDWSMAYAALVADTNVYRPHVVGIGVDGANREIISAIATSGFPAGEKFAYMLEDGISLASIGRRMTSQIVNMQPPLKRIPATLREHEMDANKRRRFIFKRRSREL